eukprot:1142135-Pelagomonas_calceolata.AAC.9
MIFKKSTTPCSCPSRLLGATDVRPHVSRVSMQAASSKKDISRRDVLGGAASGVVLPGTSNDRTSLQVVKGCWQLSGGHRRTLAGILAYSSRLPVRCEANRGSFAYTPKFKQSAPQYDIQKSQPVRRKVVPLIVRRGDSATDRTSGQVAIEDFGRFVNADREFALLAWQLREQRPIKKGRMRGRKLKWSIEIQRGGCERIDNTGMGGSNIPRPRIPKTCFAAALKFAHTHIYHAAVAAT